MTAEQELKQQIKQLKKQVKQLEQEHQKYQSLFELSGDALSILDLETGRFIECNQAAIEMHGVESEKNFLNLTPDQLSPEFQPNGKPSAELAIERIQKTFSEGPQVFEWIHSRLDGSTFPCLVSLSAIPLADRKLVLAIGRDISNLMETQNQLQRALEQADAANKAKTTFLSSMSHELRTPLNSIIGFAQILKRRSQFSQQDHDIVSQIHRSGEHLLGLINDVLDIAKIESGNALVQQEAVDISQLFSDIHQMFVPQLADKQINFELTGVQNIPQYVITDGRKIKQIIINLLSNACKFAPEGEVKLAVSYQEQQLTVAVEDNGLGIVENELEMIFKPFAQSESGIQVQEGTGLGLPISRSFARLLGGDLTVTSTLNQGSCFTLVVPAPAVDAEQQKQLTEFYYKLQPNQQKRRILVVDDIESNRSVQQSFLNELGLTVQLAANGKEAIDQVKVFQPDLIFMDLKMPVMNGMEATRRIKAEHPEIKIVILTASILENTAVSEAAPEADAILFKPFKEHELVAVLQKELQLKFDKYPLDSVAEGSEPEQKALAEQSQPKASRGTPKLLFVDDQELNQLVAEAELAYHGLDVECASSGKQALELFQEQQFDLVISDVEMPIMTGIELCQKLLQLNPTLPVIGFTADREGHLTEFKDAGMCEVFSKPLNREQIEQTLKPLLARLHKDAAKTTS